MKESKVYVVERMVKNGYYLFDETPEHFASRFTLSELLQFEQAFYSFKKNYIFFYTQLLSHQIYRIILQNFYDIQINLLL